MNATEVVRTALLDAAEIDGLQSFAAEVEAWPTGSHVWGHYAEHTSDGPRICRTENVSACHPGIASLVSGSLRRCAAAALGEPVVAFKDKLNYKQPGGAGFSPHQDKVAYPGVERVMSILVAIDDCRVESGCLWLSGDVHDVLPVDDRGVVRADIADSLTARVIALFLRGDDGRRPVFGGYALLQEDPAWRDLILFHEYFHADTGAGLGASHQTGWTGLVADLIMRRRREA